MAVSDVVHSDEQELAAVKAATLIESLPWLKRFSGTVVVVKFGGNAMVDDALKRAFAEDMVYLRYAGLFPVVVHGGGPQISAALEAAGIPSEFRGGYRYTSTEAISVVRDVLAGEVNREIVDLINEHGDLARGVSGEGSTLFEGVAAESSSTARPSISDTWATSPRSTPARS
nr:hypothetical protein GCM10025699_56950 [Microbacterium flavescens]